MTLILLMPILCGTFISFAEGAYTASGEFMFQEYLQWNYTHMNPNCTTPSGRNPCQDIRICNFAAASLAIGGWPTLCGWVGKGVPKICCGLPLVLGPTLMKRVDEEISRKRACGTNIFEKDLSPTQNKFFQIVKSLPKVDISEPEKFDPPLDLSVENMMSSMAYSGSRQGEFPWMVSLHEGGFHVCAGSLIDRQHILTAAHCVENDLEKYTVHIGNLYVNEGYSINITKIRIHPGYNSEQHKKNMALLTLQQEILIPSIPHVCLPDKSMDEKILGANTTLLRWGTTTTEDGGSKPLLCVTEGWKVLPTEECQRSFRISNNGDIAEEETDYLCVKRIGTEQEQCERGTGGPLMYRNKMDKLDVYGSAHPWFLVGMDNMERDNGQYRVFAKVSSYIDWIEETLNEDLSSDDVKLK